MSQPAIFFLVIITLGLATLLSWLGWATLPINLLGWFLLITGLSYFVGVIIVYWIRRIRFWHPQAPGKMIQQEKNDASFWFIVLGMISGFYLPPVEYLYFKSTLPRGIVVQIIGLCITTLGVVLFIWARRTLGNYYSGHVSVIENRPLIQHGPYRFIRHPAYAGYLLITVGIAVGYSSLTGLIVILFLLLPSILYRPGVEDAILTQQFGEQFKEYVRKTKRLLPGIW